MDSRARVGSAAATGLERAAPVVRGEQQEVRAASPANLRPVRDLQHVGGVAAGRRLKQKYPGAVAAFDLWTRLDPKDATPTVEFLGQHPGRTRMLIDWALENPGTTASFNEQTHMAKEAEWTADGLVDRLLAWARANPEAAREAADDPDGFASVIIEALGQP
jgi:hypothetical protein